MKRNRPSIFSIGELVTSRCPTLHFTSFREATHHVTFGRGLADCFAIAFRACCPPPPPPVLYPVTVSIFFPLNGKVVQGMALVTAQFQRNALKPPFPILLKLKIHEEYCLKNQAIRIEMPEKGSFISFIHHNRSIKVPFVVYADFEAFTEEISTCEPNDKKKFYTEISKTPTEWILL